ncbi:MAG: quinolinate synthase NadA [Fusicatenibacter sp.]|nr:quinolinate synthase NadA [Fusicatenibacter sp.]
MEEKRKILDDLKRQKHAVIMAHYYVPEEVQEVADYIGDSYYLSEMATKTDADIIVLCGVKFMGESAKILNPKKKILLPAANADCPMAHMASVERIEEVRREHPDAAVVCYVNSTAELKSHSDVCVTSSNAVKIVRSLPNNEIFFLPDEHLGRFVAEQVPDKTILLNDGYCHVHANISPEAVKAAKEAKPDAKLLVHPECLSEVVKMADYCGSTAGIIQYATQSEAKEFIVATELGVLSELKKRNPDKKFYAAGNTQICPNMKKITLDKVIDVLEKETKEVLMEESMIKAAYAPLRRMLELANA